MILQLTKLYPSYVKSDYDRFIFDTVIDQDVVSEWRSLVQARKALIARHQYSQSMRLWKLITPAWNQIKASFTKQGGLAIAA